MTVLEMIYDALREIAVIEVGASPNTDERSEDLRALNVMLDAWRTERLLVYAIVRSVFTLDAATESYTIGSNGDFNTTRPVKIERAGIIPHGQTYETPIGVIGKDEYAEIRMKDLTAGFPRVIYNDGANPLSNIYPWPISSVDGDQLVLYVWQPLGAFTAVSDTVDFPPGYAEALTYNLAIRLAPRYRANPQAFVYAQARESKANIKRVNAVSPLMRCDGLVTPRTSIGFNIYTGGYSK